MKIKPLRDQVLLEPMKEEIKKGGIILPDTVHKERPEQGKVIATGELVKSIKKNDKVLFAKYGIDKGNVTSIKSGENEVLLVNEESILAIIE